MTRPVRYMQGMSHTESAVPVPFGVASARRDLSDGVRVHILMATRNGADFLPAQLTSIAVQTHRNWTLTASDDGSTDATHDILAAFGDSRAAGHVSVRTGPCRGSTWNFLSLLAMPRGDADIIALSDQDDIWLPGKLERAVIALAACPPFRPVLYGARTIIADRAGRPIAHSPLFRRNPCFGNALVQSIAGGNTMAMNAAAARLAAFAARRVIAAGTEPACHDWWLYQIITGAGGKVIYDRQPSVLYRQHGSNQLGANIGAGARLRRMGMVWDGHFRKWTDMNLSALSPLTEILTETAQARMSGLRRMRSRRGPAALVSLWQAGLHRQTAAGNLSLASAAMIGLV